MAQQKLTFTHPRTGEKYTRTTDTDKWDYRFVSIRDGKDRWHETRQAADRRGGEVFPVSSGSSSGLGSDLVPSMKPMRSEPAAEGAACTVGPSAVSGERCGKPAVASFTGSSGQTYHECAEHHTGRPVSQ